MQSYQCTTHSQFDAADQESRCIFQKVKEAVLGFQNPRPLSQVCHCNSLDSLGASKAKQSNGGSNPDYPLCLHCTPCTVFIMQSNVIPILSRAKLFCCSSGFTFTWPTPTSTIYILFYTPFTWPTLTPTPAWPSPMAHSYSCNTCTSPPTKKSQNTT